MSEEQRVARQAALAVMAKMCLCDGRVTDEEMQLLLAMMDQPDKGNLRELLAQVQHVPMPALCDKLTVYADKFFIALRAYSMAHVDAHFDASEEVAYNQLIMELGISKEDVALIHECENAQSHMEEVEPPQRLIELYNSSSFNTESPAA